MHANSEIRVRQLKMHHSKPVIHCKFIHLSTDRQTNVCTTSEFSAVAWDGWISWVSHLTGFLIDKILSSFIESFRILLFRRYTLLVGRPPFEASSLKETYIRIRKNEYNIPRRVSASISFLSLRNSSPCLLTLPPPPPPPSPKKPYFWFLLFVFILLTRSQTASFAGQWQCSETYRSNAPSWSVLPSNCTTNSRRWIFPLRLAPSTLADQLAHNGATIRKRARNE